MTTSPEGLRFSLVYLRHPDLLDDSERLRNRLAALVGAQAELKNLGKAIEREQGIQLGSTWFYSSEWPRFYKRMELRDVLDSVTVVYHAISADAEWVTKLWRDNFLTAARRIFEEEQARYRVDDKGGVHLKIDELFETTRVATIVALSQPRYNAARALFEQAFSALDRLPPDGKAAMRSSFSATENLFRLMFANAHQLSGNEVQKHLKPLVDRHYAGDRTGTQLAQKMVASFINWIDAAHFYRHEPGLEEPAQPPLQLAVYHLNQAAGHLRWLAQLDGTSASS